MVLVAAAVLAILACAASVLTSTQVRQDREQELLFRGLAYQRAIGDYYMDSPPGQPHNYPRRLQDLLSDPRFLRRRHIRALYPEPFGAGWTLVKTRDGGIAGVASQSPERPRKQDGFPAELAGFKGAAHYSDWVFLYQPGRGGSGPATLTP